MSLIISQFVHEYEQNIYHYTRLASQAEQKCRRVLREHHIPAIITSRAKSPSRLKEKLEKRNPVEQYQTESDIRSNIPDLSGVRVAVYLPGNLQRVANILEKAFDLRLVKVYSPVSIEKDTNGHQFTPSGVPLQHISRQSGYRAIHAHTTLTPDELGSIAEQPEAVRQVEIQITSLLMHVWSEVEHDLAYKCDRRKPSEEEDRILHEINDSVVESEGLLLRLERLTRMNRKKEGLYGKL